MIRLGPRKKSPAIGLAELIHRMHKRKVGADLVGSFVEAMKTAVSDDEALDAAKALSAKGRARRYAEGAVIGGGLYPLTNAAGEAAKGLVEGGVKGMAKGFGKGLAKPEVAKSVVRGALGGTAVQAIREGVELGRAKRTYQDFMRERGHEA